MNTAIPSGASAIQLAALLSLLLAFGAAATAQEAASASSRNPAAGRWVVHDTKDPITDESGFEARLSNTVNNERTGNGRTGEFEVTATCSTDAVLFKITYFSEPNPGYQLTVLTPGPKLVARVAIDGRATSAVSSVPEHRNEAFFLFAHKEPDQGQEFLSTLGKGLAGVSVTDISPDELFGARLMKMELPLANGDLPLLEIHPQDPGFQKFASRCRAAREEELKRRNPYGPPSISDSTWNLIKKADTTKNKDLAAYLQRIGYIEGSVSVEAVPGATCSAVYTPGDILPGLLDWNSDTMQTVYARCTDERSTASQRPRQTTIGEIFIDRTGLAQLKKRRAALIAFGVGEAPAPAEPDAPTQPLPASWTTKSWFVCPPVSLYDESKKVRTTVQVPTPVSVISHGNGRFQIRFTSGSMDLYEAFSNQIVESCPRASLLPAQPAGTNDRGAEAVAAGQRTAAGWVDPRTKLMWTVKDNGVDINWREASEYCSTLGAGALYSDWRLPTILELRTIYDPASSRNTQPLSHSVSVDGLTFQAGQFWTYHLRGEIALSGQMLWSSTNDGSGSYGGVRGFEANNGQDVRIGRNEKTFFRALCVRP